MIRGSSIGSAPGLRIGRREMLAAAAAAVALPGSARAESPDDAELAATLDGLSTIADPATKLARLARFDPRTLSPSARIDLDAVRAGLAVDARLVARFPFGRLGRTPYTLTPNAGAWRDAGGAQDEAALARRIDAETARVEAEAARGVILPRPLLERTAAAVARAARAASADVARALAGQTELLATLQARAPAEPGVGRFPGGTEYFALLLERHLGEPMAPIEAYRRLADKARELSGRADGLLRQLGLTRGSVGARIGAAFRDPRFLYPDDDAGRDRAVAEMNRWLDRVRPRLPLLFGPLPPYCLNVSARRMTRAEEAMAKGGYRVLPTPQAAGGYFVDLARIADRPSWTLGSVVHHELLPGHMLQLPIEAESGAHPLRIAYLPAFAEGWAIHAEALAAEDGAYADDPRALLGHLHWLLFRIGRGLVDTGVHIKQESLAQTSAKLATLQGEAVYFAPVAQDIERICIEPAIRAAEALSWLELSGLARSARDKGPESLRNFHRKVLAHGRKRFAMIA